MGFFDAPNPIVPPINGNTVFRKYTPISGNTTSILYFYNVFSPPESNAGLVIPDFNSTGVGAGWTGDSFLDVYTSSEVGYGARMKLRGNQGVTVTGSGISAYNGPYFIAWSGGISLSQNDVIVGNSTGATGKVFKVGASLTDTWIYDLSGNLFSTADTNFTVNGVASGKAITNTAFGTAPANGIYLFVAPKDSSDASVPRYSPFIFNKGRTTDSTSLAQFGFCGFAL